MTGRENSAEREPKADSALTLQTPEGIEFVLYPAGYLVRACAWAIDVIIQLVLWLVILISAGVMGETFGIWFFLILAFVLDWFYHTAFEVFFGGQSPGKRFMGIQVIRGDGAPVSPGASFLRNLLRFADTFMFLYLIALICMLVSPGFRRFGDLAADTLVVYTGSGRSPGHGFGGRFISPALRRAGMPWLSDVRAIQPSRRLNYEEKQAILSFARRYPILGKARSDEIAGIWIGKNQTNIIGTDNTDASARLLGFARSLGA